MDWGCYDDYDFLRLLDEFSHLFELDRPILYGQFANFGIA